VIDEPTRRLDEGALRALVPRVLAGLVRRGEDFDAAEDALQEALLEALRVWPEHPPRDPRAWLATVATRRLVDARRSEAARHRREEATYAEPRPAATEEGDDTLFLLFCCCHPDLAPASQVALTLRAVGGLTTREIADAFYVPEATMAQRISRAKRALQGRRLDQPGDLAVVLRVLYLVYTAGHAGRVDLAGEAIRLARQLTLATEEPEARGLLALMLLNHARLPARLDSEGRIVTLDRQDRGLWDTREIAEGVRVLQSALAVQRPGRYQIEAAIAALHDDAASAEETDWPQILAWYDDLVALTDDPVRQDPAAVLGRAVAVGHVLGPPPGCARPTGCARCSASAPVARRPRPPARARRRPARRRHGVRGCRPRATTSPSATTSSVRRPARGPARRYGRAHDDRTPWITWASWSKT
jgi:RNA polymerase sigma factor (sigma-70 family)